jgi:uncharacterized protein YkwD
MQLHHRWLALAALLACLGFCTAADKDDKPKLSKEEQYLVDQVNEARKKENLGALKVDPLLCKAAANYSQVMIKNDKKARELMDKKDPKVHEVDGTNVGKRCDDVGYDYTECGENVAISYGVSAEQIKKVHDNWMGSKYHRANILDKKFQEIGIAIVKHPNGKEWFITQVFGSR